MAILHLPTVSAILISFQVAVKFGPYGGGARPVVGMAYLVEYEPPRGYWSAEGIPMGEGESKERNGTLPGSCDATL